MYTREPRPVLEVMRDVQMFEPQIQNAQRAYEACEEAVDRTRGVYERALVNGHGDCSTEDACECDLLLADYADAVAAVKQAERVYTMAQAYERNLLDELDASADGRVIVYGVSR